MGRVRAFEERDIPGVSDLHSRVFPLSDSGRIDRLDAYHAYFQEMFLDAPWSDGQPSLVYEDDKGEPIGFLGVMSRKMSLDGRPVSAVISSQFIVEPTRRATLAGVELIRALLMGSQDLTIADSAGNVSRKLWEGLGGATALLYSLYWVRVLRPAEFAVVRWSTGHRGPLARIWVTLSHLADAVSTLALDGPFRVRTPKTSGEELDGDALAACIHEFTRDRMFRPEYDGQTATWILDMLARKPGCRTLRRVLVRSTGGVIAGWYVYCVRDAVGEVLQVGGSQERIGEVLDHLLAQARRDGVVVVVGRIDPRFADAFALRHCVFHHRGEWMLIHARDPKLVHAIQRGDAFLSRLEGEWCMRFQAGYV